MAGRESWRGSRAQDYAQSRAQGKLFRRTWVADLHGLDRTDQNPVSIRGEEHDWARRGADELRPCSVPLGLRLRGTGGVGVKLRPAQPAAAAAAPLAWEAVVSGGVSLVLPFSAMFAGISLCSNASCSSGELSRCSRAFSLPCPMALPSKL